MNKEADLRGKVTLNGITIPLKGPWSEIDFMYKMQSLIGTWNEEQKYSAQIVQALIELKSCSDSFAVNELLRNIMKHTHIETGFKHLQLSNFPSAAKLNNFKIDEDILEGLVNKTWKLETLTVRDMAQVTENARREIIVMLC